MDADGGNAHALTTDAPPKDQVPDWSPDGTKIVVRERTGRQRGHLGHERRRVGPAPAHGLRRDRPGALRGG